MKTTLADILAARDNRAAMQRSLMAEYHDATLLCATVVMPGSEKQSKRSMIVAETMTEVLRKEFSNITDYEVSRDLSTGYELYMLIRVAPEDAKLRCARIEERHPLGRLFDIDVIKSDGIPMSRSEVGLQPRSCILCSENARICMRRRTHSAEEIDMEINRIINEYLCWKRD